MDTTLQYAQMCRKAAEIQELWTRGDGDLYLETAGPMPALHGVYVWRKGETNEKAMHDRVWLPRQDKLQDMVIESYRPHWQDSVMLGLMEEVVAWGKQLPYASMDQCWLCFVMHVKYAKVWTGAEWVSE